jgi:DNA-binding SARP family transcriptional activator
MPGAGTVPGCVRERDPGRLARRGIDAVSGEYRPRVLEFRILGPLEVVDDGGRVRLDAPKQRATLAILLLDANRVVSVERLAEDLYAGAPPVTAVKQVQRQISDLRKALGAPAIETRPPGYVLHVGRDELDLHRFERLTARARDAFERGRHESAAELLGEALALWRGRPLEDLAYESFAQSAIERLEEIRLAALERRVDADLALGRHADLVGELGELVVEHPLHERFRGQLMLALYRSGRQAEALEAYRTLRAALVEQLGIEPSSELQALQRAVLTSDESLEVGRGAGAPLTPEEPERAVLVVASDLERLDDLLGLAEPLVEASKRELIVASLLDDDSGLAAATETLNARRAALGVEARTAAFTSADRAGDVVRLAAGYDVDVVLLHAPEGIAAERLPDDLAAILERSPADVAVLVGAPTRLRAGQTIDVPFAGGEHDWAALELAASLSATGASLRLVGTRPDPQRRRRDASRLLADASLAVQKVVGIETEPVLADPGEESLVAAVESAAFVVAGISPRWRTEGIGSSRRRLVRDAAPPVVLVHRGPRPSALAPRGSETRFTWSIDVRSD